MTRTRAVRVAHRGRIVEQAAHDALPTDERGAADAGRSTGRAELTPQRLTWRRGAALPLADRSPPRSIANTVRGQLTRGLADEDVARLGELGEPRGNVDRVADDGKAGLLT